MLAWHQEAAARPPCASATRKLYAALLPAPLMQGQLRLRGPGAALHSSCCSSGLVLFSMP